MLKSIRAVGIGLVAAMAAASAGPALALPAEHEYWVYYSDATYQMRTGTLAIHCTGRIVRTGYETEFAVLEITKPCFVFPDPRGGDR
ncbi:hypothetical protein [Brevundimonas sp. Bb-A]|jgi:hypothetical protein|uniref:hypothetical protein n=1 Tax=Brevundimonas sp. Bb-A TaxID=2560058 RepID=UPI00128EE24D|nr:hypothetical protein [Brevundimonas sp. Bb-A]QFU30254.1 hypothetical protein BSP_01125 [Brevundimonas sp. Bb-A]